MTKSTAIILIYICLVFAAACGKKAPPVPPSKVLPDPPQSLSFEREKDGILLVFKLPEKNIDGTPFSDFKGVEVFKADVKDEDTFCPNCDESYERIYKGDAKASKGYVSFKDKDIRDGALYYYIVRIFNSKNNSKNDTKGVSGFSAPVKIIIKD
jgi:hypothetical protein